MREREKKGGMKDGITTSTCPCPPASFFNSMVCMAGRGPECNFLLVAAHGFDLLPEANNNPWALSATKQACALHWA